LLCFPVLAQAESSSEIEYSDAPPTATGKRPPAQHEQQPTAKGSTSDSGGSAPSGGGGQASSGKGSEGKGSSSSGGVESLTAQGNPQGNPGGGKNGGETGPSQQSGQAVSPAPASHEGGGSSPLVPILIAIAVLAAVSLGVLINRQRRAGGPSSPASPEAN